MATVQNKDLYLGEELVDKPWTQKSIKNQFREIWLETNVKTFFGNPASHRENLVYFGLAKVKF